LFYCIDFGGMGLQPSLLAQASALMEQALAIREKVKVLAYESAVKPLAVSDEPQVILQVGHWKMGEVPWELRGLHGSQQSQGGGKIEWEINLAIAEETKKLLEAEGIGVTLVPAIFPTVLAADAFVSIHADQNPSLPFASGFTVASSAYDQSGKAGRLAQLLGEEYRQATWLDQQRYIPGSMRQYYAFNSTKFMYAIHPDTPSAIIETGYLPNPRDRAIILTNPQMAAQGIARGITKFLKENL
jgi:hypothetical protein